MATDYDEEFPLGIVPMLTFGDTWLADVDAYLATVQCMYELSERTPVINIHLQRERDLLFWKITEICAVQLLCKRVLWDLWDHESLWLVSKAVDQVYNLAKSDFVGYGAVAVRLPVGAGNDGMVGAGNDGMVGAGNDGMVGAGNDVIPDLIGDLHRYYVEAIVGATVFVALKSINHFLNEIINVKEFHLYAAIVYLNWKIISYVVAEGCNC